MCGCYIGVYILDVPYHADRIYTYAVPPSLQDTVEKGTAVVVPFGPSNRKKTAVVAETDAQAVKGAKNILECLSPYFKLNEEMLGLCIFMKRQTLCTFGDAVKCVIPSALITKTTELFYPCSHEGESAPLYEYIKENPGVSLKKISDRFVDFEKELKRLIKCGAVKKDTAILEKDKSKYETRVSLAVSCDQALDIADGRNMRVVITKKMVEAYQKAFDEYEKEIIDFCAARNVTFFTVLSDDPIEKVIFEKGYEAEVIK